MKHYLLFLSLFVFIKAEAQLPNYDLEPHRPNLISYEQKTKQLRIDTTYYPFYNDVQAIKIAYQLDSYYFPTFFKTDDFLDASSVYPIYIFRNKKGKIILNYNFCGREINLSKLRKVENLDKPETHNFRFKHAQSHEHKKWGKFGVYPIYVKDENSKNEFKTKCGLMDSLGNILLEPIFENIEWKDAIYIVQQNKKFGVLNENFESLIPIIYDSLNFDSPYLNLMIVKRVGNYGLMNANGKILLPTIYRRIAKSKYRPDKYEVYDGSHWQFYDYTHHYLSPTKFNTYNVRTRDNQLLTYENGWIMMDTNGNILCKSENEITEMVTENRFLTMKWKDGYHRQIVNKNGVIVNDKEYYYLNKLNSTTLLGAYDVVKDEHLTYGRPSKYVLLDNDGGMKSDDVYDSFEKLTDNYFQVWQKKKGRVVNDRGITMLSLSYTSIGKMNEKYFLMREDKKVRFLFLGDNIRYTDEYEETLGYSDGMLSAKKNGKWGFLDSNFTEVIPFVFERVTRFKDGMAEVVLDGKTYVINKKGENFAKINYDHHQKLIDGYVKVTLDSKFGMIDEKGNIKIPAEYDKLSDLIKGEDKYYLIAKKGKYFGIINEKNEMIHPFIFESGAELSVRVSGDYNRRNGFYAFCSIEKRNSWEYYYFNFDDKKSYMKIGENPTKGFKKFSNLECERCDGKKYGIKNWEGKIIVPAIYDGIHDLKNNTFQVGNVGSGAGIIDTTGKIIVPIAFKYVYDLGTNTNLVQVGCHGRTWGLYDYSGKMLADTIYGGFDKPIFGLIPFFADFNFRIVNGERIHDKKKIGFMNYEGKIIVDALYETYRIPDQRKEEIVLYQGSHKVKINSKGKVLEGELLVYSGSEKPKEIKPKTKKELRKEKRKNKKDKKKKKVRYL